MAKVILTTKMEEDAAVYCLKVGRASPEQQKLAYQVFTRPKGPQPKNVTKEERRAFTVESILSYMEKANEPMNHSPVYREVAAISGVKADTVRRYYERFLNRTKEEQTRILKKVEKSLWHFFC